MKPAALNGRRLTMKLSEPAEVDFIVERRDGREWVELRRTFRNLGAGRQVLELIRLAKKTKLKRAFYRVTIMATDDAGNVSSPVRRYGRVR